MIIGSISYKFVIILFTKTILLPRRQNKAVHCEPCRFQWKQSLRRSIYLSPWAFVHLFQYMYIGGNRATNVTFYREWKIVFVPLPVFFPSTEPTPIFTNVECKTNNYNYLDAGRGRQRGLKGRPAQSGRDDRAFSKYVRQTVSTRYLKQWF